MFKLKFDRITKLILAIAAMILVDLVALVYDQSTGYTLLIDVFNTLVIDAFLTTVILILVFIKLIKRHGSAAHSINKLGA
jgi:hypothetical protein